MKKIVITVVMFAIALALIAGVILPLADHGRDVGSASETKLDNADTSITNLAEAVH